MKKAIFLYHSIGDIKGDYNGIVVSVDNFKKHMDYLQNNYLILPLEELMEYDGEENAVAITFDDGYKDFYDIVYPIIVQMKIPVTIFVTTGIIENQLWTTQLSEWIFEAVLEKKVSLPINGIKFSFSLVDSYDRLFAYDFLRSLFMRISEKARRDILVEIKKELISNNRKRGITRQQIVEMSKSDLVVIGAHTVSHLSLGELSYSECKYEIEQSIKELESMTNKKITLFSYPYGREHDYNKEVKMILENCGINYAYTVNNALVEEANDKYEIPRIFVDNINGQEYQAFIDSMMNKDCILDNYVGNMIRDIAVRVSNRKILIWGTGNNSKQVYDYISKIGKRSQIIGYIDSKESLWGKEKEGLIINSIEKFSCYSNVDLIIKNTCATQIVIENKFNDSWRLHIWL